MDRFGHKKGCLHQQKNNICVGNLTWQITAALLILTKFINNCINVERNKVIFVTKACAIKQEIILGFEDFILLHQQYIEDSVKSQTKKKVGHKCKKTYSLLKIYPSLEGKKGTTK